MNRTGDIMKNNTKTITMVATMIALVAVATLIDKAYSVGLKAINGADLAVCTLVTVVLISVIFDKFYFAIIGGAAFGLISFIYSFVFVSPLFQNPLVSVAPRLFVGIISFGIYKIAQLIARYFTDFAKKIKLHFIVPIVFVSLTVVGFVLCCIFFETKGWQFFAVVVTMVLLLIIFIGLLFASIIRLYVEKEQYLCEWFSLMLGSALLVISNTMLVLPMMYFFGEKYESLAAVYMLMTIANFVPELLVASIAAPPVILRVRKALGLGVDGRPKKKLTEREKEINIDVACD